MQLKEWRKLYYVQTFFFQNGGHIKKSHMKPALSEMGFILLVDEWLKSTFPILKDLKLKYRNVDLYFLEFYLVLV